MEKKLVIILSLLLFLSCTKHDKKTNEKGGLAHELELAEVRKKFEVQLLKLYDNPESKYSESIIEIDTLINHYSKTTLPLESEVAGYFVEELQYLKAELLYTNRHYKGSIKEINNSIGNYPYVFGNKATALAANYVMLNDYTSAKSYIDSLRKGDYIYNYANAQYYECIQNKEEAIKFYKSIVNDSSEKRRFYFKIAQNRLRELNKKNVVFEKKIIFPTMKPDSETFSQ